jgi:hypothetical protein
MLLHFVASPIAAGSTYTRVKTHDLLASRPPLSEMAEDEAQLRVGCCAELVIMHKHNPSCGDGRRYAPTDQRCRYAFPRIASNCSEVQQDGLVRLQRQHPMLAGYLPAVMLASPCNCHAEFMNECSRALHKQEVARQLAATADPTDPPSAPLELLDAAQHAADEAFYTTKYDRLASLHACQLW